LAKQEHAGSSHERLDGDDFSSAFLTDRQPDYLSTGSSLKIFQIVNNFDKIACDFPGICLLLLWYCDIFTKVRETRTEHVSIPESRGELFFRPASAVRPAFVSSTLEFFADDLQKSETGARMRHHFVSQM
jgi:hypothetical protein